MYYRASVKVRFKKSVLEPQGQAILLSLHEHGDKDVSLVRVGKLIELDIQAQDENEAREKAKKIADELLANPVMETFDIDIEEITKEGT